MLRGLLGGGGVLLCGGSLGRVRLVHGLGLRLAPGGLGPIPWEGADRRPLPYDQKDEDLFGTAPFVVDLGNQFRRQW